MIVHKTLWTLPWFLALAFGAVGPAFAASEEANIFNQVCAKNAPALDSAAIKSAAANVSYSAGNILSSGGVAYDPGRTCKVVFPIQSEPDDSDVRAIASEFAGRTGGTMRKKKSAIGGAVWYEVRIGNVKFGIEGGISNGARYFMIARR